MSFVYKERSLPVEYNYVLAVLCGIYPLQETLSDSIANAVRERLIDFLETGEINRASVVEGSRDPFLEFWKVYGQEIDNDVILTEDVEYCLEWLGKREGLAVSDGGN